VELDWLKNVFDPSKIISHFFLFLFNLKEKNISNYPKNYSLNFLIGQNFPQRSIRVFSCLIGQNFDKTEKCTFYFTIQFFNMTSSKVPENLWLIHGKLYDFKTFVSQHPGGENFIIAGKGKDITEVFESVHVLSKKDMRKFIIGYEVETPEGLYFEDYFNWKEDGFYSTLTKKLRKEFEGKNYKSTFAGFFKCLLTFALAMFSLFQMVTTGSLYHACLYGIFFTSLGFTGMHEASHGGLSTISWINESVSVFWNSWGLWNHWIWLHHHIISHHSYTSIYDKDPDVVHWYPFLRKSEEVPITLMTRFQSYYVWLINVFPGQFLGQIVLYKRTEIFPSFTLFGIEVSPQPSNLFKISTLIGIVSFIVHFVLPFYFLSTSNAALGIFLMYFSLGFCYWACVSPNHDTEESLESMHGIKTKNMDWGELQVRSSANHSATNSLLDYMITMCWGGMNYQTEHHLFPSISHIHYPTIAPIVKETCKDFGIPYACEQTWFGALCSYYGFLKKMETL
jgi:acyl-lipid (8-3)-desaturase